jgi:hypothetical protein
MHKGGNMTEEDGKACNAAAQEIVDKYFNKLGLSQLGVTMGEVVARMVFMYPPPMQAYVMGAFFNMAMGFLHAANREAASEMEDLDLTIMYPKETVEAMAKDPVLAAQIHERTAQIKNVMEEYKAGRIPSLMTAFKALGMVDQMDPEEVKEAMEEEANATRRPH